MSYLKSENLLRRAHAELDAAYLQPSAREQFIHAHMAALRGAAAALAAGAPTGVSRRHRLRSAWDQLADLGEEWQPWVAYYLASAQTRAGLESGQLRDVGSDDAREAVRAAGQFLATVEGFVGDRQKQFTTLAQAS